MSNTQTDRTVKRRHLHYVLRTGTPEPRTPMFDSVENWNWAVRISVVGLFVVALAVIAFKMASVVVPAVLAWDAAAWLRLCPSQRRPRHAGIASLARSQEHPAHGALHRTCAGSI